MKTTNFIKYLFAFIIITSCSKDDGEQGIQGEQGPQGEQGTQGEQGEPGTANILYSEWIDQDWNLQDNDTYKAMLVDDENVNDSFLENGGIVLGFFRFEDHIPYPLPYQDIVQGNIRTCYPIHSADGGNVRFNLQSTDGNALTNSEINGLSGSNAQFKYVLVPGGTPITASKSDRAWKQLSYKEVCKALNIPE